MCRGCGVLASLSFEGGKRADMTTSAFFSLQSECFGQVRSEGLKKGI
jgi:hypothetical protein